MMIPPEELYPKPELKLGTHFKHTIHSRAILTMIMASVAWSAAFGMTVAAIATRSPGVDPIHMDYAMAVSAVCLTGIIMMVGMQLADRPYVSRFDEEERKPQVDISELARRISISSIKSGTTTSVTTFGSDQDYQQRPQQHYQPQMAPPNVPGQYFNPQQ